MIDRIDAEILRILQANARTSNAEIARQVGLAPSAVFERIRKLEERGVISGYEAKLNPRALGLGLVAYIYVRADEPVGSLRAGQALDHRAAYAQRDRTTAIPRRRDSRGSARTRGIAWQKHAIHAWRSRSAPP